MSTDIHNLADRLVKNEVVYCVSALISTLSNAAFADTSTASGIIRREIGDEDTFANLFRRAPDADDFRDAAPHDVDVSQHGDGWMGHVRGAPVDDGLYPDAISAWQVVFDDIGEDYPDGSEVYEHWIVSDFLADALIEQGETVAKDIAGLTVWGRCTSGQSISLDSVIQRIALATYGEN